MLAIYCSVPVLWLTVHKSQQLAWNMITIEWLFNPQDSVGLQASREQLSLLCVSAKTEKENVLYQDVELMMSLCLASDSCWQDKN